MKKTFLVPLTVLAIALTLLAQDRPAPLRLVQTIPLSVDGRLDHLSADVKGMRLFVAALGNNSVEVIDLRARCSCNATGSYLRRAGQGNEPAQIWSLRSAGLVPLPSPYIRTHLHDVFTDNNFLAIGD